MNLDKRGLHWPVPPQRPKTTVNAAHRMQCDERSFSVCSNAMIVDWYHSRTTSKGTTSSATSKQEEDLLKKRVSPWQAIMFDKTHLRDWIFAETACLAETTPANVGPDKNRSPDSLETVLQRYDIKLHLKRNSILQFNAFWFPRILSGSWASQTFLVILKKQSHSNCHAWTAGCIVPISISSY